MKTKITRYLLALVMVLPLYSCNKWLDVQPKTKIKSEDLLLTEQGYKDALIGVYTLMTPESLYGRELSFGFFDAVTKSYDATPDAYRDLISWKPDVYNQTTVKPRIDGFWGGLYNIQANINNILDHIDQDRSIFTDANYSIIKGEALALRAFIHFDLFKMFALSDPISKTQPAIPYVTTLSNSVTKSSTGNEVLGYLIKDLKEAEKYLEADPIISGKKKSGDVFLNDRNLRINYYAVKAMLARVYLWQEDYENALTSAQIVMSAGDRLFPWINPSNLVQSDDKNKDFSFSTEHLFALNVNNLRTISNNWFISASSGNQLSSRGREVFSSSTSYYYEGLFENTNTTNVGSSDYRLLSISDPNIVNSTASTNYYVLKKYYQPMGYNIDYANRIPLIRRSEMNYIAAEAVLGLSMDEETAIDYLNEVRRHRGIVTDLPNTLGAGAVRTEITKEYWKEFRGEGQFFFYCKRNNIRSIPTGASFTGLWANYSQLPVAMLALPKPVNEIEYNPDTNSYQ